MAKSKEPTTRTDSQKMVRVDVTIAATKSPTWIAPLFLTCYRGTFCADSETTSRLQSRKSISDYKIGSGRQKKAKSRTLGIRSRHGYARKSECRAI
eukprot:scaffold34652_cov211-Amphora_coffeaeformis.AAC.1